MPKTKKVSSKVKSKVVKKPMVAMLPHQPEVIIVPAKRDSALWFMSSFAFIVAIIITGLSVGAAIYTYNGYTDITNKYNELKSKTTEIRDTADKIQSGSYDGLNFEFEKFEAKKESELKGETNKMQAKQDEFNQKYSTVLSDIKQKQDDLQKYVDGLNQALKTMPTYGEIAPVPADDLNLNIPQDTENCSDCPATQDAPVPSFTDQL